MSKYTIDKGLPIPERNFARGRRLSSLTVALLGMEPGDSLDFGPKKAQQVNGLIQHNCKGRKFAIRGTRVWRVS